MDQQKLFVLKERLISDLRRKTRKESFASDEAYQEYLRHTEDGILALYVQALISEIDFDAPDIKSA